MMLTYTVAFISKIIKQKCSETAMKNFRKVKINSILFIEKKVDFAIK